MNKIENKSCYYIKKEEVLVKRASSQKSPWFFVNFWIPNFILESIKLNFPYDVP